MPDGPQRITIPVQAGREIAPGESADLTVSYRVTDPGTRDVRDLVQQPERFVVGVEQAFVHRGARGHTVLSQYQRAQLGLPPVASAGAGDRGGTGEDTSRPRVLVSADGGWRLVLPPAYAAPLRDAGITPLRPTDFFELSEASPDAAPAMIVLPAPGARPPVVVVAGLSRDSVHVLLLRPAAARGPIGLRRLLAAPLPADAQGDRKVGKILSVASSRGQAWVRWQDGDCEGPGVEWLVAGADVTRRNWTFHNLSSRPG